MENISTDTDDFMLHWLPNCEEMIQKVLKNKNILAYPTKSSDMGNYKVFDFTSQRIIGENDDDFISVDQKQAGKQKVKPGKKTVPTSTTTTKKNTSKGPQTTTTTKMKITQTIASMPDWKVIADFNKLTLEKLRLENIEPEVEDKLICGSLYQISDEFEKDRINQLNPIPLQRFDKFKFFGNISTLEDEKMKTATEIANVFVTDKILSVIMTCVYNSRPWHLKITKVGESVFIDKMTNSEIDLVTVNESDNTPQDEDDKQIDSFKNLAIEATLINEFIKEQIINQGSKIEEVDQSHPFADESEGDVEHLAYRYRLWKVGDMDVLVRCQVHAFDYTDDGDVTYVNVYALNEFDRNTYLSKEQQSTSHLLKKEMQTNHLKITKWGVNSYLAGVDTIKIGFVTRKNIKVNTEHLISGFYEVDTNDLLKVTNFNKQIGWGIVKQIIDLVRNQQDGTFILMKTFATAGPKSVVRLYRLPGDAPVEEEEEEY